MAILQPTAATLYSDVMAIVKVSIDINDRHIDVGGGTIKVAIAVLLFVYCGS